MMVYKMLIETFLAQSVFSNPASCGPLDSKGLRDRDLDLTETAAQKGIVVDTKARRQEWLCWAKQQAAKILKQHRDICKVDRSIMSSNGTYP